MSVSNRMWINSSTTETPTLTTTVQTLVTADIMSVEENAWMDLDKRE